MLLDQDEYEKLAEPHWSDVAAGLVIIGFLAWGVITFIQNAMEQGCM